MTKFPNPPMYPSQVQLLEQNLTIKMKNNSWISRLSCSLLNSQLYRQANRQVRGVQVWTSSSVPLIQVLRHRNKGAGMGVKAFEVASKNLWKPDDGQCSLSGLVLNTACTDCGFNVKVTNTTYYNTTFLLTTWPIIAQNP